MAHLTLVSGGIRSGKSRYAQQLGESIPGPRVFLATGQALDETTRRQVKKYQYARRAGNWRTVEEPFDLHGVLGRGYAANVLLIDSLSSWVENLISQITQSSGKITERKMSRLARQLVISCRKCSGEVILVTTEVGMGLVPESREYLVYADLIGRCNQVIGQSCDRLIFMVAGEPLEIKNHPTSKSIPVLESEDADSLVDGEPRMEL